VGTPIAIVGVSGFSGIELAKLVSARRELELVSVFSDRWRGELLGKHVAGLGRAAHVVVRPQAEALMAAHEADVVLLATPAEVSAELAPKILANGSRVLDLSGAFRLPDPDVFRAYYRFEPADPAVLAETRYALPQLPHASGGAPAIETARLVSNPGCYATAAILPLAALLARGLVEPEGLFIDGKSGVTGAGRKLADKYLFTEVAENLSAYRVADHQHTPEIELALSRIAGRDVRVTFAPHLVPLRRGLVATCFGRLHEGVSQADLEAAMRDAYPDESSVFGERIVEVVAVEDATVAAVHGTPRARIAARADTPRRAFVAIGAIDNLMKGAASQALENLLAMLSVPGAS
jgi:N-acetyl-gamma-glutamyl-phosphate reductase